MENFDFSGWATKANIKCSDGRIINKDAFKNNNGQTVPLVWNHQHDSPDDVLGHALLENREEGVYAYCSFNDTESGKLAKVLVQHGDLNQLSIYANQLKQQGPNVTYGNIRELSLVHAGANPGAFIESVIAHSDDHDGEAIIYTGETLSLAHSDKDDNEEGSKSEKDDGEETLGEVFNSLSEKQKTAVYAIVAQTLEGDEDDETNDDNPEGGNKTMKHNVFDKNDTKDKNVLTHSAQMQILNMAKSSSCGSLRAAMEKYAEDNNLQHDALSGGFAQTGEGSVHDLFPDYQDVRPGAPELITDDQGWVEAVMRKVHKAPMSRIRTRQADIREIKELRAKGYKKGKEKQLTGNFKLVSRTTDPYTIYVKNALNRDDIVDIDFDYVAYMYGIDLMMLKEELATAILISDGREDGSDDKIPEDHIRPIWLDNDLYTLHVDVDINAMKTELQGTDTGAHFGKNFIYAESMINTILHAREKYRGTGKPDFFCTPHMLNVMLLARDMNGRRIYNTVSDIAMALNVGDIHTVEKFADKTRKTEDGSVKKLLGLIVNLTDYTLGATKKGEVTHFTDFDIDFNQEKSLIETRKSGALTRVYSAIAIEEPMTNAASNNTGDAE
ncbi:MAG: HK97 family phage prohead protease [Ruminococcus sp.]|nr:HK97 family phage prohead protease [Ruminococcus sp.]